MTIIPDKLSELFVVFSTGNVKSIIIPLDRLGEVEDLATRANATKIDYVFDFGRLGVLVDIKIIDKI